MKALTTLLAERATAMQDAPAEGLKAIRDAAQARIAEPVVDACSFSRPASYAGNLAARQFGLLGKFALGKVREARAGGLPQHFVLAVTETEVVALEETFSGRREISRDLGPEVARWGRATLDVASKPAGYLVNVTLSSAEQDERVECCVAASPLSWSFLGLLADPARQTPATSTEPVA
jgi:hypothetical protein